MCIKNSGLHVNSDFVKAQILANVRIGPTVGHSLSQLIEFYQLLKFSQLSVTPIDTGWGTGVCLL